MNTWFRVRLHLSVALGLSMAMSLGLLVVRYAATGRFGFRFLVWNLFLAAIPFPLALLADWLLRVRQRVAALPALAGWLLFLPNAPYLVTDILHVQRSDAPLWYDALLYGSFAVSGMLLCFGSVALVHIAVRTSAGQVAGWIAALTSLLLAGFGVYLGRVERWNSWNFWQTPRSLARSILEPVQNPLSNTRTIGFTVVYGAFLCVSYISVAAIGAVLRELASVPVAGDLPASMSNAMDVFVVSPGHLLSAAAVAGVDASYGDAGPLERRQFCDAPARDPAAADQAPGRR